MNATMTFWRSEMSVAKALRTMKIQATTVTKVDLGVGAGFVVVEPVMASGLRAPNSSRYDLRSRWLISEHRGECSTAVRPASGVLAGTAGRIRDKRAASWGPPARVLWTERSWETG
jgi:hypothetical protein